MDALTEILILLGFLGSPIGKYSLEHQICINPLLHINISICMLAVMVIDLLQDRAKVLSFLSLSCTIALRAFWKPFGVFFGHWTENMKKVPVFQT